MLRAPGFAGSAVLTAAVQVKSFDIDRSSLLSDVLPGPTLPLVTRMFLQGL
jgi:hypothetical protein